MTSEAIRKVYSGFHGRRAVPEEVMVKLPSGLFVPNFELSQEGWMVGIEYAPQEGSQHDDILAHHPFDSEVFMCVDASRRVGVFFGEHLRWTDRGWVG